MADFEPPSFSLGFDLDLDSEPETAPRPEPSTSYNVKPAKRSSAGAPPLISNNDGDDDDFETPTMSFGPKPSDPPQTLKRLRRGPTLPALNEESKVDLLDANDEIEEFSSQEDPPTDNAPKHPYSVCSSSKFPLNSHGVIASESAKQSKYSKKKVVSNASAVQDAETISNKLVFPDLHISPLRKFQLIDSDSESDEPFPSKVPKNVVNQVDFPSKERESGPSQVEAAELNKTKASVTMSQVEDLWKDIHLEKTFRVPTPAFDEVCEEYFRSVKDNNEFQNCDKACYKTGNFSKNNVQQCVSGPLPPAHSYYNHEDLRIQKLVRARLSNFLPLGTGNSQGQKKLNSCTIDYMSQFNHGECSKKGKNEPNSGGSSARSRKNVRKSSTQEMPQETDSWINTRSSARNPKDAGKRRVHAVGKSAGHWYTAADGRRVYVAGNGKELTGRIAYRQYRRESGAGFKKSKKKAATKKKTARKKK